MINLLPIGAIIRGVSVCYAVLVVIGLVLLRLAGHEPDVFSSVKLALAGALPLQLLILYAASAGWRTLWRLFPWLGRALFPDINGEWDMTIHWQRDGDIGVVAAIANVKQDFWRISMEVRSPGSDSQTLSIQPKRDAESGHPMLHYLYRVTPHVVGAVNRPPYNGAAILWLDGDQAMQGNYWTSLPSIGHFSLTRKSPLFGRSGNGGGRGLVSEPDPMPPSGPKATLQPSQSPPRKGLPMTSLTFPSSSRYFNRTRPQRPSKPRSAPSKVRSAIGWSSSTQVILLRPRPSTCATMRAVKLTGLLAEQRHAFHCPAGA